MSVLYGMLYVYGGQTPNAAVTSAVEFYNPANDSWADACSMVCARMYHGLSEARGLLFAVGNHDGLTSLASVEPTSNTWSLVHPMPSPHSVVGVACFQDSLYVAGGYSGEL